MLTAYLIITYFVSYLPYITTRPDKHSLVILVLCKSLLLQSRYITWVHKSLFTSTRNTRPYITGRPLSKAFFIPIHLVWVFKCIYKSELKLNALLFFILIFVGYKFGLKCVELSVNDHINVIQHGSAGHESCANMYVFKCLYEYNFEINKYMK